MTILVLPSMVNMTILILKETAILSIISLPELTLTVSAIGTEHYAFVESFTILALVYWALVEACGALGRRAEARLVEIPVRRLMSSPAVRVRGLTKDFGGTRVLDGIDLDVPRGEVTCIIGPSGSGKSTLLRCVAFLEEATGGLIEINGDPLGFAAGPSGGRMRLSAAEIRKVRGHVGMVFQQFNLWPHMTALGNVVRGAGHRARHEAQGCRNPRAGTAGGRSASRRAPGTIRASSPAASSSAWRSPAPWRSIRRSCCSTSRPPRSTPN